MSPGLKFASNILKLDNGFAAYILPSKDVIMESYTNFPGNTVLLIAWRKDKCVSMFFKTFPFFR